MYSSCLKSNKEYSHIFRNYLYKYAENFVNLNNLADRIRNPGQ